MVRHQLFVLLKNKMYPNSRCLTTFYKYKRKLLQSVCISTLNRRTRALQADNCRAVQLNNLKILFFGTDNFSLPSLKALHTLKSTVVHSLGVVTSFKSPANCVRVYAEQQELPLHRWCLPADVCRQYDLGVVVSFGHLIPTSIIQAFPYGMINVHASLLPRWRGAAPVIYAIMQEDRTTGVSIMKIEPKHFDIGDILAQEEVPIGSNVLMPELHAQLAQVGAELLIKVLRDFPSSLRNATKQSNEGVTFAPKITSSITEIIWSKLNAQQIYNRFRALYGFKHMTTQFHGKSVQLIDIKLPANTKNGQFNLKPGAFVYEREEKCLLVNCAADTRVEVHQLRLESKKIMSAMDFNNGYIKKFKVTDLLFNNKTLC